VGSDLSRRSILGNVLNSLESSADEPAVPGNVLVTIRVDVAHFATGAANGLGVGLGLPTGVATALLSKARSQSSRRVGWRLISRVVVRTRLLLIMVPVVPVVVARGTVVQIGMARITVGFVLVGGVLIPTVLATVRMSTALWIVSGYCSLPMEYWVCKVVRSEPHLALEAERRKRQVSNSDLVWALRSSWVLVSFGL